MLSCMYKKEEHGKRNDYTPLQGCRWSIIQWLYVPSSTENNNAVSRRLPHTIHTITIYIPPMTDHNVVCRERKCERNAKGAFLKHSSERKLRKWCFRKTFALPFWLHFKTTCHEHDLVMVGRDIWKNIGKVSCSWTLNIYNISVTNKHIKHWWYNKPVVGSPNHFSLLHMRCT